MRYLFSMITFLPDCRFAQTSKSRKLINNHEPWISGVVYLVIRLHLECRSQQAILKGWANNLILHDQCWPISRWCLTLTTWYMTTDGWHLTQDSRQRTAHIGYQTLDTWLAGDVWKWLEMAGLSYKWLHMTGHGWKWLAMTGNEQKRMELTGNCHGWTGW